MVGFSFQVRTSRGSDQLAETIRSDIADRTPGPIVVTRELAAELGRRRSFWPSTGRTRNIGPWATGLSARRFRASQGRDSRGRFGASGRLANDAKNRSGVPYAGYVVRAVNAGPVRAAANFDAVRRTWTFNAQRILRRLLNGG